MPRSLLKQSSKQVAEELMFAAAEGNVKKITWLIKHRDINVRIRFLLPFSFSLLVMPTLFSVAFFTIPALLCYHFVCSFFRNTRRSDGTLDWCKLTLTYWWAWRYGILPTLLFLFFLCANGISVFLHLLISSVFYQIYTSNGFTPTALKLIVVKSISYKRIIRLHNPARCLCSLLTFFFIDFLCKEALPLPHLHRMLFIVSTFVNLAFRIFVLKFEYRVSCSSAMGIFIASLRFLPCLLDTLLGSSPYSNQNCFIRSVSI